MAYALGVLARSPDADMVSIEPADGGGECECDSCAAIGTCSDQAYVHGPDGAVLRKVESSGDVVSIDVPPDADGKLWHFSRMWLHHLWFFDAPNSVASSPGALLLPRELAERDGLVSASGAGAGGAE